MPGASRTYPKYHLHRSARVGSRPLKKGGKMSKPIHPKAESWLYDASSSDSRKRIKRLRNKAIRALLKHHQNKEFLQLSEDSFLFEED